MRARRVDANQAEVVEALRQVGASVMLLHTVGHGCPDLACGYRGQTYLLEVKTATGKLNECEARWHAAWRGHVCVITSPTEALEAIGAVDKPANGGQKG